MLLFDNMHFLPPTLLCFLVLVTSISAFQNFEAAVRESDVEGLVGESVRLPCEVDKASCGPFHSIKWYKENDRVFIFSEMAEVKRPEGSLLERTEFHYSENRKENWLEIFPLKTEDEGTYKCEITYLAVKEACSVVQFVNLKTLARPISFDLTFEDGSLISNGSTIGPFPEGDDVTLKCQAGGAKPVPSVKWFNGSERIQGRFQSTVDEGGLFVGSNSIQFTPTRYDLGRQMSCEVLNDAMKAPVYLLVQIDVDVAPASVTIDVGKSVIEEGEEVTIVCSAKGAKPLATIMWRNGTTPIQEAKTSVNIQEDTTEIKLEDGTYETQSRLTFDGTRYENNVPFVCEATNAILEKKNLPPVSHSVKIDVQFPPTVLVEPENMTLNESMDFILFCQYTANPTQLTHVYWYLDGHQLDIAGRPEKYRNGNVQHPSLLVVNASADDMGEYTCRVANIIGASEVTNSAYVNIQYRPEVVVLAEPEGPFSEEMKPNVTLICDVIKAHPETLKRVRWFLNGQLLKELPECEDNSTALYDSQSEFCNVDPSRLLLEYVIREFHGNYSCEGMNAAGWGQRSASAPVVVNYKPGLTTIEYQPEMVIKGEPVILTCNALDPGRPIAASFRWTKNSRPVRNITTRVYKIDSASLDTKANFTCVPINSEGEGGMASVDINVLARPTFITPLPPYHGALMSAEEVSLLCHVECSPNCSISWLKDNRPLDNDTHYRVKDVYLPPAFGSIDFESVKSILSWKMEQWPGGKLHREIDNANYSCISSANIAGDGVSSTTIFRVEYPPERISISSKLLQVKEDEVPEKIKCVAYSYPEPSYYWVHNEETVIQGSILNLGFPVKRNRAGQYACIAENRHGKQMVTTVLDVLFKPECKIDRHDSSVGDSAAIVLKCRAYANPQEVSFRWRLGNETLMDSIENSGLESQLTLEASPASLGTYYCYVNNSVGESIPCEIDVTGLLETLGDDNLLLYAIIAVAVIILVILIILLVLFCRRQRQRGKYSDPSKRDKTSKSEAAGKDSNNGTKDNRPSSPYEEGPTFYENLPFHGIQAPPNKASSDEESKSANVNTSSGSRPSSQLSHQASSGYGSTRSQGGTPKGNIKVSEEVVVKDPLKKPKKDVSFLQDIDDENDPKSSFERRGSESYGSMHRSSIKAAKNALARTAAYLSVRVPKKPSLFSKNQRSKSESNADGDSAREVEDQTENTETEASAETPNSTFVTSESFHSLNAKGGEPPHSFIIEATQTSTLTLHSKPPNELNNNTDSGPAMVHTEFNNSGSQMRWGSPKSSTHWAYSPSEASTSQKHSNDSSSSPLNHPTPAPRNANIRPRPTYQNIPSSSKSKKSLLQSECPIQHPHEMHVLPVENRRKISYDPNSKIPSTNTYSITPPSSNASSPSSQYQQPYQSSYPPQNYPNSPPPIFNHYSTGIPVNPTIPPMYPSAARYHPSSYPNALDRQYSSESSYSQSNSVHSYKNKYQQPVVYTDLNINHNGLPNNYKRDHSTDYAVLQFNELKDPVIGQEIDV